MTKTICDVKDCGEEVPNNLKWKFQIREPLHDTDWFTKNFCPKHQQQLDKLLSEFLNNN